MKPLTARGILCVLHIAIAGCGEDPARRAGPPTSPTVRIQQPPLTYTLSGEVFEITSGGRRVIAGAELEIHAQPSQMYRASVVADSTGRYTISGIPAGVSVALAYSGGPFTFEQQCVASNAINGPTSLDVQLGRVGPDTARSPIVTGTVYQSGEAGERRVADAFVWFDWDCLDGQPEAFTRTDAAGRYELCRIPPGGCINVISGDGSRSSSVAVDVRHDTVVDLNMPAPNSLD